MDIREIIARAVHTGRHKGLSNCWSWDDDGLDDEHPQARKQVYRDVESALSALAEHNITVEALQALVDGEATVVFIHRGVK